MSSSNTDYVLQISQDFSEVPAGRYLSDGDFTGERFREDFLMPALIKFDIVTVNFDGAEGYGSSFLEEAFGGLVRVGVSKQLLQKLKFISNEDPSIINEVMGYIDDAAGV